MKKTFDKIKEFAKYFVKKNSQGDTTLASAHLAFYLLLSFIPLLMLISQVIVYVVPNFGEFLYDLISNLPEDVQNIFKPVVDNILESQSSSLSLVAIGSSLWAGSRGFLGLKKALNAIFNVETQSKIPFFDIIFSILYTIVFMILLALLLLFSVYNEKILSLLRAITDDIQILNTISRVLIDGIGLIMPFALAVVVFIFFYKFAPSFDKKNRISFFESLLGAIVATVGIAAVTFFYKLSNDVLTKSPSIYGSLGSVLVSLVWLLAICQMIIFGSLFIKTYIDVVGKGRTVKNLESEENIMKMRKSEIQ